MARRRAEGTSFTFDLEPDDGEELFTELPVEPSRFARVAEAARARVRAWPRRRVVAVGTAVAVVVAGGLGAAALTVQARHRSWVQVAQTAPGAVVDLGHAPVESWRVEMGLPTPVGLVGETLVVRAREWGSATGGDALHGVDLAAGRLLWTTPAPDGGECSVDGSGGNALWPAALLRVERGDVVVCLGNDRRTVTVVDGAGQVLASRDLEAGDEDESAQTPATDPLGGSGNYGARRVLIARDGAVLRLDRVGSSVPPPSFSVLEGEDLALGARATLLSPLVTRDLRVRLEDAVTGEIRWETIVDSADLPAGTEVADGSPCMDWSPVGEPVAATDQSWFDDIGPRTLATKACGVDVTLDLVTGEILEQQDVFGPGYEPWRTAPSLSMVDGGWGEIEFGTGPDGQVQDVTTRVMRPDGSVVGEVPGVVLPPLATDGPASALLVAVSGTGTGVAAYDADDASLRWQDGSLASPRVLARTTQAVVVSDGAIVMALDRQSGARLWKYALYGDTIVQPDGGYGIVDTMTDGRHVAVVAPAAPNTYVEPQSGEKATTTLDLVTGKVVWTSTSDDPALYPIAGRLYRFDYDGVVAFE